MAALKHDDEELYNLHLEYPDRFSPDEMEENFEQHGYEVERENEDEYEEEHGLELIQVLENVLEEDLSDYDSDIETDSNSREQLLNQIAEDYNATIHIHTTCIDSPIQVFGQGDDHIIHIYEQDEGEYFALKPMQDRTVSEVINPPRRKRLMSVHTNDDVQILWNVSSSVDMTKEIVGVVIDCEVVRKDPMEVAKDIVNRAKTRQENGQNMLPRRIHDKKNRNTPELEQEYRDATKLCNWKQGLKGKGKSRCSEDVKNYLDINLPGWRYEQEDTPVSSNPKIKSKKSMEKPNPSIKIPVKTLETSRPPAKSQLSILHQKYKTMNSSNLHDEFQTHPETWHEYHRISEENEQSFPDEEIPHRRIIQYLETLRQHSAVIADLGCGKARIHQHFPNQFQFHNFDHVAYNPCVIACDIQHTGLPEASVDIAILCLAMWGSNCESYIEEAYRILDKGGRLLIIEPTRRWIDEETGENRLQKWIQSRFTISTKEERKFMFLEAFKVL